MAEKAGVAYWMLVALEPSDESLTHVRPWGTYADPVVVNRD